jgi:poly(3-hydroxybutyrate) depolymerase
MNHARTILASMTAVLAVGLGACGSPAAATGPSYPACSAAAEECVDRLDVGSGLSLPFYRNFSLTATNAAITQAVIVVHGSNRDADDFYHTVETASEQAGADGATLVVAPHFECPDDSPPSGDVYWQCSGDDWSHGYADASGAATPVYSYAVIDQMVSLLANKATLPNLTRITVTGLSAGGQLTQRYAATNEIDPVAGVAMQYLVLSPSSYVYLDANRLAGGASCSAEGGCTGPFTPYWDASSCSDYDQYYYGLEGRTGYVAVPSASALQAHYVARDVTLSVGAEDTLANAAGTDLDTSCGADAQGVDRVARALTFWNRARAQYHATHPLVIVPGCMHSETCMYYSPELRSVLFPEAAMP